MLLDNDGDAVFIYTPPSLQSRSVSKARDLRNTCRQAVRWAAQDTSGAGRRSILLRRIIHQRGGAGRNCRGYDIAGVPVKKSWQRTLTAPGAPRDTREHREGRIAASRS